jgi:opacity protein-like surface antigen
MRKTLVLSALLLATSALSAEAQSTKLPQTRQGFGASVGLGVGLGNIDCDGCDFDSESALSGYLRLGGYVKPNLFIGGETTGWMKDVDGADTQIGFLNAVAQWYPQVEQGFYLKGGLGFARATAKDASDELSLSGPAFTLGAGYDWRLRSNLSLTPYLNYVRSTENDIKFNDVNVAKGTVNVLQFGIGLTWH